MINISVKNKRDAVKASYHLSGKTAIISINNVADAMYPARFNHCEELVDVLSLFFDDVLREESGAMTKEDAVKIKDFLKKVLPNIEYLIVHCSAGVSRSAGVAAAIMKVVTGSDMGIFDNPKYRPNNHCYRTTLNELIDEEGNSIFNEHYATKK